MERLKTHTKMKGLILTTVIVAFFVIPNLSISCPSGMDYIGDTLCWAVCKHYSENQFRGVGRRGECTYNGKELLVYIKVYQYDEISATFVDGWTGQKLQGPFIFNKQGSEWYSDHGTVAEYALENLIEFCVMNSIFEHHHPRRHPPHK